MDSHVLGLTVVGLLFAILSTAASDYCSIDMIDYELTAVGYIADNQFTTQGPVCPDTCTHQLVHEINQACCSKFTARCVNHCKSRSGRRRFNSCCEIAGKNHAGDSNKYYFANADGNDTISMVSYVGSY